jgi:hypothetical protein
MRKLFKHAPSPAMVVAIVAVVLALGGSAVAALSKKDKKQVKNIANNEITKRASGLAVKSADTAKNADALGGVGPSGYQGGSGHTYSNTFTAGVNTINNTVLDIPGIGQVRFDCAANGLDTTPKLFNNSGVNMSALGQTQIGATPSLDPNSTTFNNGNTLALAGRQVGTTHLQVWTSTSNKTATITISNIFCLYTASAITNQ